jgi:hypothetical protein
MTRALDLAQIYRDEQNPRGEVSRALIESESERQEQARLLGISGSREAALLARVARLEEALRKLTFAARTSGGIAGRDERLCAACDVAEGLLNGE